MIKFFQLLILSIAVLSAMPLAIAEGGGPRNGCYSSDIKLDNSIKELAKFTSCSIYESARRCSCIQEKISGLSKVDMKLIDGKLVNTNFGDMNLLNKVDQTYEELRKEGEEVKKGYYQQYSEVYKMMTSHADIQKTVFGLRTDPAAVGCTPLAMRDGIKLKMDESIDTQIAALTSMQSKAKVKYSECIADNPIGFRNACYIDNNRAILLEKRLESMKALKDGKGADNCRMALNVLGDRDTINSVSMYLGILNKSGKKSETDSNSLAPNHQKAINGAGAIASAYVLNKIDMDDFLKRSGLSCSELMTAIESVTSAYKDVITKNIQGGAAISTDLEKYTPSEQCAPGNDPMCVAFAIKNQQLMIKNAELYSPSPENENSCLSYAEFVTYKGMPSKRLLREFASSDHPEDLLKDTAGWLGHGRDDDKKAFLRANPLIMQLAQMKDRDGKPGPQAVKLGQLLKKMAKDIRSNRKEGEAGKFSRYLDFMNGEGGLKDLMSSSGSVAAKMTCNDLQNTFTAITLSNDAAKLNTSNMDPTEEEDAQCVASIYDGTQSSNLDASLKESPLYKFGEKPDGMPSEDEYKKFKEKECPKIAAYKEQGCLLKDSNKCNQKNPKMKAIQKEIEEHGVKSSFSPADLAKSNSNQDRKSQDPVFDEIYDREVTSKLNHNVLASADDKGEFHASMVKNASIQSQSNVTEMYLKEKNGFVPSSSMASNSQQSSRSLSQVDGFESNTENPEQVRPTFEAPAPAQVPNAPIPNFESVPANRISEATQMSDLDPSFNQRPLEEKLSTYKALKDYVSEGGTPPQFSPSEEIKELEKSLEESKVALKELEKEEEEKKESKVASSPASAVSRAPANLQQGSFVAPIQNAPVLGQFPGSASLIGSEAKLSKSEASYQAALMQKYNMNNDLQILIQGQDAMVEAPYVIKSNNILKADDVYSFSKLNDPKILSEFLAVKVGSSISNGESIKIMDPNSNNYFLLKATVKDGITSYQRYPFVSEKDIRISKLNDLNNTLQLKK